MNWNNALLEAWNKKLEKVCDKEKLNIALPKLIPEEVSSRRKDDKGNFDNDKYEITIYSQAHKTEEDILCSVKHEARHAWQWKHYYDFCNWWKMNIAFYNLVQTIPFCNEYRWICTHESDAEEYALYGKSVWEKTLSTDILLLEEKAREIFQKIAPACAPGKASEYIRKNYCLLRLQGWLF